MALGIYHDLDSKLGSGEVQDRVENKHNQDTLILLFLFGSKTRKTEQIFATNTNKRDKYNSSYYLCNSRFKF